MPATNRVPSLLDAKLCQLPLGADDSDQLAPPAEIIIIMIIIIMIIVVIITIMIIIIT